MIKKCLLLIGVAVSVMFASQCHVDAAETTVSNWSELSQAVAKDGVDKIKVDADLTATDSIDVASNKTIDFQKHTITFGKYGFETDATSTLKLSNFTFSGKTGNYIINGDGKVVISGVVSSDSSNEAGLANLANGSVTLDGVTLTYDNGSNSDTSIQAKEFIVTNKSTVNSEAEKFFVTAVDGSTVTINGGSNVTTNSNKGTTAATRGTVWDISGQTNFTVDGSDTKFSVTGDAKQSVDDGGIFRLQADSSSINVTNGATMTVHSIYSTAVMLKSKGGSVNVSDYGKLKLVQDESHYVYGATLRFRLVGEMTFNVENHAKIDIDKKSGTAAAVRMFGSGNKINVKNDSDFVVHNGGNGKPSTRDSSNNIAVQFTGADSAFKLTGEDSNVSLNADYGAGINAGSHNVDIDAGEDTYFAIRGNTQGGVFESTGTIQMKMGTMKYFDFTNNGAGTIFSGGPYSTFTAETTNLSMWQNGSNLNGNADRVWQDVSYSLSGRLLNSLDTSSNESMVENYGKTSDYCKMNGNNQNPVIQTMFVPTNADKHLFVRAVDPQGKGEEPRGALDGEVEVVIGIYDENGKQVAQETASSKALADMYGTEESGLVTFDAPNKEFLKTGWSAKVLSGERTNQDKDPATIEASPVTVQDVTPPNPVKLVDTTLSTTNTEVSAVAEANLNVVVLLNGKDTGIRTTTDSEGKFTVNLPENLQIGDKIQILLQNEDGEAVGVLNPPATNSTVGNIEPTEDTNYHDATFKAGTELEVTHLGELAWAGKFAKIDFGSHDLTSGDKKFAATENATGEMAVSDTRGTGRNWRVTASMAKELTSADGSYTLNNAVMFKNGGDSQPLTNEETVIMDHTNTSNNETVKINESWNDTDTGLFLEIPGTKHPIVGSYSGEINWSLQDVPANN